MWSETMSPRLAIPAIASLWLSCCGAAVSAAQTTPTIWTVPEIGALPDDANGREVRRGRDLITATYAHIGPEVPDRSKRFAGNNLACSNCHLRAGTVKFAAPLFGLYREFPAYSARLGAEITIEQRLNSCMVRSMNGRALPVDGSGDAGDGRLYRVSLDRRAVGRAFAGARCRQDARAHPRR